VAGFEVVEVPVEMHEREGGEPSNASFKLAYHFLRLLVVLTATAVRSRKPAPASTTAPTLQPGPPTSTPPDEETSP
jgi:hypothetical protein